MKLDYTHDNAKKQNAKPAGMPGDITTAETKTWTSKTRGGGLS